MSYLVLARKWRPLSFDDVVGQEHVTTTLKKAIEKNRVAHAYIFSGTRGVGKTTTARILARALNCEKGPTTTPCGVCDSCKGILSGSSLDVLEIDGASNRGIDDIRELRDNIVYSTMGGGHRIIVIDEVHMLTKEAFNALLKTLEEPPPRVIFIFATTEPQKIPVTIHSRCQRYDFRRIVPEQILDRLVYICNQEKITFEKPALMILARKADGSMRDGLSLLDQVLSYCPDKLTEAEVRLVLGLVGAEVYERIMDAVAGKQPATVVAIVQELLLKGFDLYEFILGLEEHVRTLLFSRINYALQNSGMVLEPESIQRFKQSADLFSEGDLLRMMEIIRRSEYDLKVSAFPRFAVEIVLLKLVFLDSTVSLERLLSLMGSEKGSESPATVAGGQKVAPQPDVKKKPEVIIAPAKAPLSTPSEKYVTKAAAAVPVTGSLNASTVREDLPESFTEEGIGDEVHQGPEDGIPVAERWNAFLDKLFRDQPMLGSYLSVAAIAGGTEKSIALAYPPNLSFQFNEVTKKQNQEAIREQLNAFMGQPVALSVIMEPKAAEASSKAADRSRDPIIQTVIDLFDAEFLG